MQRISKGQSVNEFGTKWWYLLLFIPQVSRHVIIRLNKYRIRYAGECDIVWWDYSRSDDYSYGGRLFFKQRHRELFPLKKEKEVSPEEQTPRNKRMWILVNVKNVFWRQKITENFRTFHLTALKTQLPHQLLACQSGTENSYVLHGDNVSQPAYPVAVARTPRLVLPYARMHAIYKRQRKIENSWNAIHTK